MIRDRKAGDVALVNGKVCIRKGHGWEHGDERAFAYADHESLSIRPVVVIDPEDREQVEWLTVELGSRGFGPCAQRVDGDAVANALRSLIAPPKPDEPTGLGAVIEDDKGQTWVRRHPAGPAWVNGYQRWAEWSDIAAVKVLSEGVTA